MAGVAARDVLFAAQVVLPGQPRSERRLIVGRVRHAEDFAPRPKVSFRVAMALEAPAHLERMLASHERHLVDAPVTLGAPDSLGDVNAVVDVREVWKVVDVRP